MKLKELFIIGLFVFVFLARAQTNDLDVRYPPINEGKLFSLKFTPGDGRFVVSVAGKPAAVLGPDRVLVFGRQIAGSGKTVALKIEPTEKGFRILDSTNPSAPFEIEVQDRKTHQKETIKIEQVRP